MQLSGKAAAESLAVRGCGQMQQREHVLSLCEPPRVPSPILQNSDKTPAQLDKTPSSAGERSSSRCPELSIKYHKHHRVHSWHLEGGDRRLRS